MEGSDILVEYPYNSFDDFSTTEACTVTILVSVDDKIKDDFNDIAQICVGELDLKICHI